MQHPPLQPEDGPTLVAPLVQMSRASLPGKGPLAGVGGVTLVTLFLSSKAAVLWILSVIFEANKANEVKRAMHSLLQC